jgi:hypothetical protein
VKTIITSALFLMIATSAFAQKVYVDPNVRTKKGLLDPGHSPIIAADKKEGSVEGTISTENDPIKKRYCACFNSQRLSQQRKDLAQKLHSNNVISWEEFKETDDIECDLVEVSAKKPKDFKKPLEALDSVCKFDEIDRKKI